jgi:NADH-quinone oxidoreductase subunit D
MFFGFREREMILDLFEAITGLRMNHAYIRPGGWPPTCPTTVRQGPPTLGCCPRLAELRPAADNPSGRPTRDVGYLDLTGCMALGITGPVLRSTGLPHDLRKSQPYCGYEDYEFDVSPARPATATTGS